MANYNLNQNPEQQARDNIDSMLLASGWVVQDKKAIDFAASLGVAIREYQTDMGPADYVLFVNRKAVGVIEAKAESEGYRITLHEEQTLGYATAKLKWVANNQPLPFLYESTGAITRFTDLRDPKPKSRTVFSFHQPHTFQQWIRDTNSLRTRLHNNFPALNNLRLRDCQFNAIQNLEVSFANSRPRALIQMATGAGKTYTAITAIYRLLKFANAKRVLFLVDTRNLGKQAEQEFMSFTPTDDNRKFTELYTVQRLKSSHIADDSVVCISTIQRMYSLLKGKELEESNDDLNPNEGFIPNEVVDVQYNKNIPPEFFDFIVIDECHRSIYNLWRQVLDYFDAFLIGLSATPDKRTYGFFDENVVSEYTHAEAVADGVNVGYEVYTIETEITKNGSTIKAKEFIDKREKLTRKKRYEQLDEETKYTGKQLDRDVVNPSQIRNVLKCFKDKLETELFPNRKEIPKTLIFAKTDSHADDIINMVRDVFGEGNDFCKKVTYQSDEDTDKILSNFRNSFNPRIAVTVDMIATGTDVKPLECLLFMRDVRSNGYYQQMLGRGTRTLSHNDLELVTPSAKSAKTHFVVIDAIGVAKSCKVDSKPMERKPTTSLKELLYTAMMGNATEDDIMSLGNRLARLEREITDKERERFIELARGKTINQVIHKLWDATDPDKIEAKQQELNTTTEAAQQQMLNEATNVFNGELIEYIVKVRQQHDQLIDIVNLDTVTFAGWDVTAKENAQAITNEFANYCKEHSNEITALRIFYNQPFNRNQVTFKMISDVLELIMENKPRLAPLNVWNAYTQLEKVQGTTPLNELTALIALIRRVTGIDPLLTAYESTVNNNFKEWLFKKQAGNLKFNQEQMDWLRMIKEHIIASISIEATDLDYSPFDSKGGIGKMYQLFGNDTTTLLNELNEVLTA
jgi:type I restriction enzyme, R subunit